MDEFRGYSTSFNGFIDYHACYHKVGTMWNIIGGLIFFGIVLSVMLQIISFIRKKTSFGFNALTVFITSWGQFLVFLNYICLHTADFAGLLQYEITTWLPRLMTLINLFTLWFLYLFVPFYLFIFGDFAVRPGISFETQKKQFHLFYIICVLISIFDTICVLIAWIFGILFGFSNSQIFLVGQIFGNIDAINVMIQYFPQIITTLKLKDPGSISISYLAIQGPGGLIQVLFMWLGNHDNWTTWISMVFSALQQFILLIICVIFKLKNRYSKKTFSSILNSEQSISDRTNTIEKSILLQ